MELVVFVDGHARTITGSVEDSTTADVITALANASEKTGRFYLVLRNKTNNMDYFLRSSEIPYKVLQTLKDRGIDACLEICDADQFEDIFPTQDVLVRRLSSEIISNEQIYGRLPSQPTDFDQMLTRINRVDLEELIRNQEKTLWQHQIKIVGLENELTDEIDREYLQLLRQRQNLRKILDELNNVEQENQKSIEELDTLNLAIDTCRHDISDKQNQLKEMLRDGEKLATEIAKLAYNH